jgi:PadR family transcriptional regulator PadR
MIQALVQNWETEIRRGVIQLLVLSVLVKKELHGKAICEKILDITDGIIEVPLGTVYPLLRRFINENMIETFKPKEDQRKTLYKINELGKQYYFQVRERWMRYSIAVSSSLDKGE